jgi:hypothetical protein
VYAKHARAAGGTFHLIALISHAPPDSHRDHITARELMQQRARQHTRAAGGTSLQIGRLEQVFAAFWSWDDFLALVTVVVFENKVSNASSQKAIILSDGVCLLGSMPRFSQCRSTSGFRSGHLAGLHSLRVK